MLQPQQYEISLVCNFTKPSVEAKNLIIEEETWLVRDYHK